MKKLRMVFGAVVIVMAMSLAGAPLADAAAGQVMEVRIISTSPAQTIQGDSTTLSFLEKLKANGWSDGEIALLRTKIGVILKAAVELEAKIKAFAENN